MSTTHNHDDPRTLVIGCPACVERVRKDQAAAALAEAIEGAPMRPVVIAWTANASGKLTIDLPIPDDTANPADFATRHMWQQIDKLVDHEIPGACDDYEWEIEDIEDAPTAPAVASKAWEDVPLFGGDAA